MKRNLITKKELEHVQKYLPAMGHFQMRTDGGAWVEKTGRRLADLAVEDEETGVFFYFTIDEETTIDYLKERAAVHGIEWRREVEE